MNDIKTSNVPGSMPFEELTGAQKAAILTILIGEDNASGILKNMSPREVQHLGTAMYAVRGVNHDTVDRVLDEFLESLRQQTNIGIGANNFVRKVMTEALGNDRAQSVLSRISNSSKDRPIEILDWMDPYSIAELIHDEHPQIIALVIASLESKRASDVLNQLPDDMQPEIIERIATLSTVQPDALRDLEMVMQKKFQDNTTLRASQIGGVKSAARIMNFAKQNMEQRIMKEIKSRDKELMQNLQDNMFVFDNLIKSDDRSLQTLLRSVDPEILVVALKGADVELAEKLLGCMSQRQAEGIRDDMGALGPLRLSDVQEAQKQVINIARRMSDEGTIVLAGRGGEEMV